jgi:hypothetical protein
VPEESLLTDELRALVALSTPLEPVTVTRRGLRRALEVFGVDGRSDYADGEDVPGYALAALEPEYAGIAVPNVFAHSLLITNEWELLRPLRMGETLSTAHRIVDIAERFGGKFGYSLDFHSEYEFRDASGALVARSARTMRQYDPSQAREAEE